MGEGIFQPMHLLVIFAIALLVFGPRRLPELGKGLGEAIRGFKDSFHGSRDAPPKSQEPNALSDADHLSDSPEKPKN
jgi:sec-independent protein translocase protein TatA